MIQFQENAGTDRRMDRSYSWVPNIAILPMNGYFGLRNVILKQTEKRPSFKKENKWTKIGEDFVNT